MKTIYTMLKDYITEGLRLIHLGSFSEKMTGSVSLALFSAIPVFLTEAITQWTIDNATYILFVLGAIIVDHLIGSIIHLFIKRDFSILINITGLLTKIGLAVAMGFLFEGINHILVEDSFLKNYLVIVLRLTVFLYPAGSAFMNCSLITNGKFPPIGFIKKVKKFQVNLDLKEFKKDASDIN